MLLTLAFAVGFVALAFIATALPAAWMRKRHGVQQPIETRELARDVAARIGVLEIGGGNEPGENLSNGQFWSRMYHL